jgi:hypothetical protein
MKGASAEIKTQTGGGMGQMEMNGDVWISNIDIGARPELGTELVDDGILDLSRAELVVTNRLRATYEVHGKCGSAIHMLGPVDLLYAFVERVGIWALESSQTQEHTAGAA